MTVAEKMKKITERVNVKKKADNQKQFEEYINETVLKAVRHEAYKGNNICKVKVRKSYHVMEVADKLIDLGFNVVTYSSNGKGYVKVLW